MNPNHPRIGQWAGFAITTLGSATLLFATPQSPPVSVSEITAFIQMDLGADKKLEGADIKVRLDDGIAILTGEARSLAQAERAAARAIASAQVRAVVNQVRITAAPLILENSKSALRDQKMFRAEGVTVAVKGDRVALSGKAGTWDEKDLAREIISEVPGVVAIDNEIIVTFEGQREDSQIAAQLQFMIQDDPLYEGLDLVASVNAGTVRLGGQVGSRGEYDRLVRRCYVTGVMDVQISGLSIDSDLAMEGLADKDYTTEESLAALRGALEHDNRIDAKTVRAVMADGTVTLQVSVAQIAERDAVESTARGIPGVLRVSNELKISGAPQLARNPREFKAASPPLIRPRR